MQDIHFLECNHFYHKECLQQFWKTQIEASLFPLTCMNHECRTEATEADITQVLGPELLNKYRDFSLNQAISKLDGVHRCQTPECPYAFVLEGNLNDFTCPLCKVSYCLKCNDVKHDGVTCEDMKLLKRPAYEEDKELIILAQEKNWKSCPFCKAMVERTEGCDHMKCRCGKEFCYKCGGVYKACECVKGRVGGIPYRAANQRLRIELPARVVERIRLMER